MGNSLRCTSSPQSNGLSNCELNSSMFVAEAEELVVDSAPNGRRLGSALTSRETMRLLAATRDIDGGVRIIDELVFNVFFFRAVMEDRIGLGEGTELSSCMISPKMSSS